MKKEQKEPEGMFNIQQGTDGRFITIEVYDHLSEHGFRFNTRGLNLIWHRESSNHEWGNLWLKVAASESADLKFAAKVAETVGLDLCPTPQIAYEKLRQASYVHVAFHPHSNAYIPVESWPAGMEYFFAELEGKIVFALFAHDHDEAKQKLIVEAGKCLQHESSSYLVQQAIKWLAVGTVKSFGPPVALSVPPLEAHSPTEVAV